MTVESGTVSPLLLLMQRGYVLHTLRPTVALALLTLYTLTLAAAYALTQISWLHVAVATVLMGPLILLSVTDLERLVIPDGASLLVASVGLYNQLQQDASSMWNTALFAFLVFCLLWVVSEIYWRKTNTEALGLGDAKLISAGILCVGIQALWLVLLVASLGGIFAICVSRMFGRSQQSSVPFGPFLAYSIFTTFLLTGPE